MKTLEVDVLKLYAGKIKNLESTARWNHWLTWCLKYDKLDELEKMRKGLQMGMATAQRKGLASTPLAEMFCRWTGSIESTMRKVLKKRDSLCNDRSASAKKFGTAKTLDEKRQRDIDFELWLRKNSY